VRVRGEVMARIRQTCVVTLDPFETELREPVDLTFAAEAGLSEARADRIDISPDDEDPPELLLDGKIDLGSVTLEFLALGLDAYPRKPGARFAHEKAHESMEAERAPSPFAALAGHPRKVSAKE
jgi:Large ribosomal RNA subunit accumulation protein YceD